MYSYSDFYRLLLKVTLWLAYLFFLCSSHFVHAFCVRFDDICISKNYGYSNVWISKIVCLWNDNTILVFAYN